MNGIILLDKPSGKTSHDMVGFVRRMTHMRKVGHTGTLDPLATGVLPVCVGNATKAAELLTAADKRYTAELILGMSTDTLDCEGNVLSECRVDCTEKEIIEAIKSFRGEIEQIPPMYSAIKKDGKKLYELARAGIEIEREARTVTIHEINIMSIDMNDYRIIIDVHCSKGTYIRTLCDDIGKRLGVGAYMNTLRRTKSGMFNISECLTVKQIETYAKNGELDKAVIPTDMIFREYPKVIVGGKRRERVINGAVIHYNGSENSLYRIYDEEGNFLSVSRCIDGELKLEKAFWQ